MERRQEFDLPPMTVRGDRTPAGVAPLRLWGHDLRRGVGRCDRPGVGLCVALVGRAWWGRIGRRALRIILRLARLEVGEPVEQFGVLVPFGPVVVDYDG